MTTAVITYLGLGEFTMKQDGLLEDSKCPECEEDHDVESFGVRHHCKECDCWWKDEGVIRHGNKYKAP